MADDSQVGVTANSESVQTTELDVIRRHVNFDLTGRAGGWASIPELPTPEELNPIQMDSGAILNQLKDNEIRTPYVSKDDYLETHYRIQREEGITQLRHAIQTFKANPQMVDEENVCVYTKVFIQGYMMTRLGPLCRIEFSTERARKRIRWTHTRRLTPGTLVAISTASDSFKTICKPAVIADRLIKGGLDQNPSVIQLSWARVEDAILDPNEELVMVEARLGYFEAVRHCMVGLQHVAAAETPFDKHLVGGVTAEENPTYIRQNPYKDLMPLVDNNLPSDTNERARLENSYRSFNVLGGIPDDLGRYSSLDSSQLEAVHRILTKELAIIQGPPGTGKTYTSVQALRVLLESQKRGQHNVIIVAAETNHAVDQLLTQLIKLNYSTVRLGGRTKDEEIKKYNMFNLRKRARPGQIGNDREFRTIEKARLANVKTFEIMLKDAFPDYDTLIDPELLLQLGIITQDQISSLISDDDMEYDAPDDRPARVMGEWLGDSLVKVSARKYSYQLFEDEEFEEDDVVDERKFDVELDDCVVDEDEEDGRLSGVWVSIKRKWTGTNAAGYTEKDLLLQRQLSKSNLWDVDLKFRGAVYEYWQKELLLRCSANLRELLAQNIRITKNLKINRWFKDSQCIQNVEVQIIGCTTTGLTKYRGLLAALKPRTILVEEAAQSREANIASALFDGLEQLILVGDHQQLVPHCDTPGLARYPYWLEVSMFQRLVMITQMPFTVLNQQRRMIPALREVLNPFYPQLRDHPVVRDRRNRPPIPGMPFESFLFNHSWPEATDPESLSKYNLTEAEMVIYFIRYLLMNGVKQDKITVLTFYRGQRKKILQYARMRLSILGPQNIKVNTVDSYQGEENDIIILSLVRSNKPNTPGRAGFVQDKNRGVVSISRAKRGLYIFGNVINLEDATDESYFMWGNVKNVFQRQGRYDPDGCLPIRCQNHEAITFIDDPGAWENNHGGCWEPCRGTFNECGHACKNRLCHPMPHSKLICQGPCQRKLRCVHGCRSVCGDECRCSRDCSAFTGAFLQQNELEGDTLVESSSGESTPRYRRVISGNVRGNYRDRGSGRGRSKARRYFNSKTILNTQGQVDRDYATLTMTNLNLTHDQDAEAHPWDSYDAAADDASIARRRHAAPMPVPQLIEIDDDAFSGKNPEPAHRDTFRQVNIGDKGQREKIVKEVVTDSSNSASPENLHTPRQAAQLSSGSEFSSSRQVNARGRGGGGSWLHDETLSSRGHVQNSYRGDLSFFTPRARAPPSPQSEVGSDTHYTASIVAEWEIESVAETVPQSPIFEDDEENLIDL